jgi:hypothetical protein
MTDHDETDRGRGGRSRRGARFALMATLAVATLAACSTAGPSSSPSPSGSPGALAGRTFLSTNVTDGGAPFQLIAGTRIRLTFQQRDLGLGRLQHRRPVPDRRRKLIFEGLDDRDGVPGRP